MFEVGILVGVFNVVLGVGELGKLFVLYCDVDCIVFMGLMVVGKLIM